MCVCEGNCGAIALATPPTIYNCQTLLSYDVAICLHMPQQPQPATRIKREKYLCVSGDWLAQHRSACTRDLAGNYFTILQENSLSAMHMLAMNVKLQRVR